MFPNGIFLRPSSVFRGCMPRRTRCSFGTRCRAPRKDRLRRWFFGALVWLWLVPLVLAAIYYLIPHFAHRPVRAYPSSVLAFWLLAFLGGWTGTKQLIGGPVPAWMVSASVAASIMMLIPATIICINTFGSLSDHSRPSSPAVSFTIVGLACFVCVVLQGAATPILSAVTHFSDYSSGENVMLIFGFLSMSLFGALYYVVPRLTGVDFSPGLASWHFWTFVCGAGTMFLCLTLGGLIQGFALYDPGVDFMSSLSLAAPFRVMNAVGALALFVATVAFAGLFVRNLLGVSISCRRPARSFNHPGDRGRMSRVAHARLWDLPCLYRSVVRYCRLFLSQARSHGAGRRRKHRGCQSTAAFWAGRRRAARLCGKWLRLLPYAASPLGSVFDRCGKETWTAPDGRARLHA